MNDHPLPLGFRAAGVHSGLKREGKLDLCLVTSELYAVAAGVFTQNLVCAAPVTLGRQRTPSDRMRAVVINSGNANACTGEQGQRDAREMADRAAAVAGGLEGEGLAMSTGVIGRFLPMEIVRSGIDKAAAALGQTGDHLQAAARAIMTTDTVPKLASRRFSLGGREYQITGIAKGAAMIAPNLGTMLALVMTDAPLPLRSAEPLLQAAVADSFNCITVDGHMSTNDTVLLVANGAAGGEALDEERRAGFAERLNQVCLELARAIPADGEGATHLITIEVSGCSSDSAARRIARAVAESPLVKTAIAGGDPNWGRIVSAAGYAGPSFDPQRVRLWLNGQLLYQHGRPEPFDALAVSSSIRGSRDTLIELDFGEGDAGVRFWTTDLTAEYVRLNADYTT